MAECGLNFYICAVHLLKEELKAQKKFFLLSSSDSEYWEPNSVNFCALNVYCFTLQLSKEEGSRCGRQGRTVGLLQDRKKYSQAWGEKERISCSVLPVPTVEEMNYITSSSSAFCFMLLIFFIIRENYTLSCCIKDNYLLQSLWFSVVLQLTQLQSLIFALIAAASEEKFFAFCEEVFINPDVILD